MTPRPRWWRRPLTLSTIIAVVLHVPFTPAFPILRALQRLSIMREQPREEEPPDPLSLPVELIEPPRPEPTSTAPDNAVTLPPPPRPGADPRAPEARKASEAKKADDQRRAEEAKKAAEEAKKAEDARKAEEAKKAAEERKAEARKKSDRKDKDRDKDRDRADDPDDGDKGKFAQGGDEPDDKDSKDGEPSGAKNKAPRVVDAVGLKGKLNETAGKPAVSLAMWLGEIREHPLGGAVADLMACNPEWKPFLQKGVKPMEDLEGLLMVGPQITSSRKATIAVQHRVDEPRVREVLGALIQRSGASGRWLQEGVAQVLVQRSERVMFTHADAMLFVAPADGWRKIYDLPDPISLPASKGRVVNLTLQKPAKMLRRFGVELPSSLTELRLDLYANRDGSVDAQLDLIDTSEQVAAAHAPELNKSLGQLVSDLTQVASSAASLAPAELAGSLDARDLKLPSPEVTAVGPRLTTTLRLTAAQTGKLLGLFSRLTCKKKR